MAKKAQSQWDFGELFPKEQTRKVYSVAEITGQIKKSLEGQFASVWVAGEISNLRFQSSGHVYFTLKDEAAQIQCVLFRSNAAKYKDLLADGRKVHLGGQVTVYEPRGQYQMVVNDVELQGIGALQAEFERLKRKLQAEGLFEADRKRALPALPECIGIVTSPTGAAIKDVLHVLGRRHPTLRLVLIPCRVQGDGAAREIAKAIGALNEFAATNTDARWKPEMILVTRGGGSLEDLWAFNEEVVARAIAASELPVISAVGHEIDFTISDFVADVRAATPSAAAEMISEAAIRALDFLTDAPGRLRRAVASHFETQHEALAQLARRLKIQHPTEQINQRLQRLDDLGSTLQRLVKSRQQTLRASLDHQAKRLAVCRPDRRLARLHDLLNRQRDRLLKLARTGTQGAQHRLREMESRLRLLSPQNTLERGYSITFDAQSGRILRKAAEAAEGATVRTQLATGELTSTVTKVTPPANQA